MSKDEDVLKLLDSIGKEDKTNDRKSGKRAKKPPVDESVLDFINEFSKDESKTNLSNKSTARVETKRDDKQIQGNVNATSESSGNSEPAVTSVEPKKVAAGEPAISQETESVDVVKTFSNWWSGSRLWDSAANAANLAAVKASDAVKQAESRVKDLDKTIDEHGLTFSSLQSRLTSVLTTIVPPISHHEQLTLHVFHDMVGYSNINLIVYKVFEKVMQEVEGGGDLNLVPVKGKDRHRAGSNVENRRNLNFLKGSIADAKKLAAANVEPSTVSKESDKPKNDAIRTSEIYISIQAVVSDSPDSELDQFPSGNMGLLYFVVHLADFQENIKLFTVSQEFPGEWAQWEQDPQDSFVELADPREWTREWLESGLSTAIGVIAQKYVTVRMGFYSMNQQNSE